MTVKTYSVPDGVTSIALPDGSTLLPSGGVITADSKWSPELMRSGCVPYPATMQNTLAALGTLANTATAPSAMGVGDQLLTRESNSGNAGIVLGQTARMPSHYASILQRDAHRCKGEIGVGNKGVIALRTDDWQDALRTTIQPLLQARGLPFSHAMIDGFQTEQPWGAGTTWANIQSWSQNGMEIWSHGFDHKDYLGWAGLVRNVVTSKANIEAQGFKVQGFSLPGATPIYTEQQRGCATPYNGLNYLSDYASKEGALICETYPLSEAYVTGSYSQIPCPIYHGRGHVTLDSMTLAAAKAIVDDIELRKLSVRFMWHSGNIGQATYMSLADFTAFLDYVVARWDAGGIDVVTPSALPFVTKSTNRCDLLTAGDFTGVSAGTPLGWKNVGSGHTIYQTGGINNGPYCDVATSGPSQRPEKLLSQGFAGETFLFEGWTKSLGGSTTTPRVIIQDYPTPTNLNLSKTWSGIGNSAWVRVRVPFTIPRKTAGGADIDTILVMVTRNGGDNTGWANCSVKKV